MNCVAKMPAQTGNLGIFQSIVGPWYESLKNPAQSQSRVLSELVSDYRKTRYGKVHRASEVEDITDFRSNFPILSYSELDPYLAKVRKGDYKAILPQPLVCWVMTRGSTGVAKVLPATRKHLEQILTCGARALINYAHRKRNPGILTGRILNLNFPSAINKILTGRKTMTYGYSSGTYARLNPAFGKVSLLPVQEEVDVLGPGIAKADWHRRFELVYKECLKRT